ncbi:MAG: DoxX family protein [Marivita sp.]|uniref:DoxX family protein n=1 Tax=Marivita sp. TaxID=2003365 RepID=UPI0025BAFC8A|nr:DoxX family protein [Marivita sp.]MCI5112147.1 DoxX family protein [Marivita sp.]
MAKTGWILSGLFALFMVGASAAPKLLGLDAATSSFDALGWPQRYVLMIGLLEIGLTLLYLYPATSLLGAVLMTGLLGGAIASQLRVEALLFSHTLFGLYLGVTLWVGLWLRSPRLRDVFPLMTG